MPFPTTTPDRSRYVQHVSELQLAQRSGNASALARIRAHHPQFRGHVAGLLSSTPLSLVDAQLVIAREHGFRDWSQLEEQFAAADRLAQYRPHPSFDAALSAFDSGDAARLSALMAADPDLPHARTNLDLRHGYFAGATLLHHVAGNPTRDGVRLPQNIVDIARLLLVSGSDANASTEGLNGGDTMGLVLTSRQASDAGVSGQLIDLLVAHGAVLDLQAPGVLDGSLANHAPKAAGRLIELGAKPDVLAAAALGRMDLLSAFFDGNGRLREPPVRRGTLLSNRNAIGLALLYAYVNRHGETVTWLQAMDGNWDMTGVNNGAILHRAAAAGDLQMVQRMVRLGADISNRDNPFNSTPLSWAQHHNEEAVYDWISNQCRVDLHDAVCFDLRSHVVARLREDPSAIDKRIDQWEIPDCTPLHWAAWLRYDSVSGTHFHDEAQRADLVELLLDHGADPNAVAGNGLTPLDIAHEAGASSIASLLERRGGKSASKL